jgi:hypothetical protein
MNYFINLSTLEVVEEEAFRAARQAMFQRPITAEELAGENHAPILQGPAPVLNAFQYAVPATPVQILTGGGNLVWITAHTVHDFPAEQIATIIADAKTKKLKALTDAKIEANSTSFTHLDKQIAFAASDMKEILSTASHVALFDALPAGWPGGWKAIDNSVIMMPTAADFKAMIVSMTTQGTTNFTRSQVLKAQVAAINPDTGNMGACVAALEAINAITW